DVAQEREPALNLLEHLFADRLFLLRELQFREERLRLENGERRHLIDRAPGDAHVARLAPQARSTAVRAGKVPAVPAEEHANVHLVLLPLQPAEESADAVELVRALDDERLLFVGELRPRDVEANPRFLRSPLQLRELRPIVRLAPRLDGALLNRLRRIGHDQIHVELDDVAEAMARRTGAERIVERKQPRLRILVRDGAAPALEAFGEQM